MSKLRDIWEVLRGRLSSQMVSNLQRRCRNYEGQISSISQELFDAKREFPIMRAAIDDLKDQLRHGGEAQRKTASDEITNRIVNHMKANPEKYLP